VSGGNSAIELNKLTDVNITSVADGESLIYDSSSSKWVNSSPNSAIEFSVLPSITLALDGATTTSQENLIVNPTTTTTNCITNSDDSELTTSEFIFGKTLDLFPGSSLSTVWTSHVGGGTGITVTGGYVQIDSSAGNPAWITSNGAAGVDFKSLSGDSEIVIKAIGTNPSSSDTKVQITNGSTAVNLHNLSNVKEVLNIIINKSASSARVFTDGVEDAGSPFDISSVTTNWYLQFYSDNGIVLKVYLIAYLDGTASTATVQSSTLTIDNSNKCIAKLKSDQNDEGTFTLSASADNGAAYTTLTNKKIGVLTAGTQGIFKYTKPWKTSLSTTTINLPIHDVRTACLFGNF